MQLSVSCTISAPLPAGSNDDEHDSRLLQPYLLLSSDWVNEWVSGSGFPNPSTADQLVKEEGVSTRSHTLGHTRSLRAHSHPSFYNESFQGGEPPTSSWGVAPKAVAKEMLGVALWYFESRFRGQ